MPSQKPRIALTVPEEMNDVLDRLNKLTGLPKTKLIVDMLEQYIPIFSEHIKSMEKIKADEENGKALAKEYASQIILDSNEKLGNLAKQVKDL